MNLLNRARLIMHFAVTNDAYQADRALQRLAETVQFEARHRH
jgi:hypothetical protein